MLTSRFLLPSLVKRSRYAAVLRVFIVSPAYLLFSFLGRFCCFACLSISSSLFFSSEQISVPLFLSNKLGQLKADFRLITPDRVRFGDTLFCIVRAVDPMAGA